MTPDRRTGLGAGLCAALLCSGASALLFETLWFRLAGLALGNGIQELRCDAGLPQNPRAVEQLQRRQAESR